MMEDEGRRSITDLALVNRLEILNSIKAAKADQDNGFCPHRCEGSFNIRT